MSKKAPVKAPLKLMLLEEIKGLGALGDVVRVRPGFARNYLLPRGLATVPSDDALRRVGGIKKRAAQKEQETLEQAKAAAAALANVSIHIEVKAGEGGHLYGSVTETMISDALAKGDVPTVLGLMSDKVEWHEAEHFPYWSGAPFIGPQAVLNNVLARVGQDFDGFTVDVGRLVGCGETVLSEVRYRGTAKATGKRLDLQVAHVWDVRDGKIARFQQYADTWQVAQVTGITPRS